MLIIKVIEARRHDSVAKHAVMGSFNEYINDADDAYILVGVRIHAGSKIGGFLGGRASKAPHLNKRFD